MDEGGLAICVSGPSGVGKTTVVKKLAHLGRAYIEDVGQNPHFSVVPGADGPTHGFLSQQWFLERIEEFVVQCSRSEPVVIDQAPAATVEVYARQLLNHKRLRQGEFEILRCR